MSDPIRPPISGRVASLHLHPSEPGAPLSKVEAFEVIAQKGIVGNGRYFGRTSRSTGKPSRRQVTLIEREQIAEHAAALGLESISPGAVRSNIETLGINLIELIGRQLHDWRCSPAFLRTPHSMLQNGRHLARLAQLMQNQRQGVLAEVIQPGLIRIGDATAFVPRSRQRSPRSPSAAADEKAESLSSSSSSLSSFSTLDIGPGTSPQASPPPSGRKRPQANVFQNVQNPALSLFSISAQHPAKDRQRAFVAKLLECGSLCRFSPAIRGNRILSGGIRWHKPPIAVPLSVDFAIEISWGPWAFGHSPVPLQLRNMSKITRSQKMAAKNSIQSLRHLDRRHFQMPRKPAPHAFASGSYNRKS